MSFTYPFLRTVAVQAAVTEIKIWIYCIISVVILHYLWSSPAKQDMPVTSSQTSCCGTSLLLSCLCKTLASKLTKTAPAYKMSVSFMGVFTLLYLSGMFLLDFPICPSTIFCSERLSGGNLAPIALELSKFYLSIDRKHVRLTKTVESGAGSVQNSTNLSDHDGFAITEYPWISLHCVYY